MLNIYIGLSMACLLLGIYFYEGKKKTWKCVCMMELIAVIKNVQNVQIAGVDYFWKILDILGLMEGGRLRDIGVKTGSVLDDFTSFLKWRKIWLRSSFTTYVAKLSFGFVTSMQKICCSGEHL